MALNTIFTSIFIGLLATASPCVFPLYPGFLAYLSSTSQTEGKNKKTYFMGFFVLLGVLLMMLILGAIIALLSISVGSALSVIIPFADVVIVGLGILLLLNINPFKQLPQLQVPVLSHPYVNAFLYGMLYGPIALPCSGPLVVSIFALSLTIGDFMGKLSVFLFFGLGFGLPLLILSFLAGATKKWITRFFARYSTAFNRVAGILLIGIGVYDFLVNWEMIRALLFG
jgi:cytochrome c-type biogenesis protein